MADFHYGEVAGSVLPSNPTRRAPAFPGGRLGGGDSGGPPGASRRSRDLLRLLEIAGRDATAGGKAQSEPTYGSHPAEWNSEECDLGWATSGPAAAAAQTMRPIRAKPAPVTFLPAPGTVIGHHSDNVSHLGVVPPSRCRANEAASSTRKREDVRRRQSVVRTAHMPRR